MQGGGRGRGKEEEEDYNKGERRREDDKGRIEDVGDNRGG